MGKAAINRSGSVNTNLGPSGPLVRGAGMRMVGPNCMGILSTDPAVRLDATFSPVFPPSGNVSMVSESGAEPQVV